MHVPDLHTPDLDRNTLRQAFIGGGIATMAMGIGVVTVGLSNISGDARTLLEAALPVAQALFTTAMIASSTTLTLMLTMLGMTEGEAVKGSFYGQIRQAATLAVSVFSVATVVVLILVVPFGESDTSSTTYTVLYYVITGVGALVGGALVAVMITIHGAIRNLIGLVDQDSDADIAADSDSDE